MKNRTIHQVEWELARWRVLAMVSSVAMIVFGLWSATERMAQ